MKIQSGGCYGDGKVIGSHEEMPVPKLIDESRKGGIMERRGIHVPWLSVGRRTQTKYLGFEVAFLP